MRWLQLSGFKSVMCIERQNSLTPPIMPIARASSDSPGLRSTRPSTVTLRSLLSHIADPTTLASDAEMTWTGRTVERVTGVGLDAYVQDNVLAPLDMADTHFRLPATLWNRTAGLHSEVSPGVIRATSLPTSGLKTQQTDQAVLYSTALDSLKLLSTLLRRDTELLSGRAYQELGRIRPAKPKITDVIVYRGLFNSHCWVDRRSDTAGLLFTQLVPHGHRDVNTLFDAYHTAVRTEHHASQISVFWPDRCLSSSLIAFPISTGRSLASSVAASATIFSHTSLTLEPFRFEDLRHRG